jgi:hypothetical protein
VVVVAFNISTRTAAETTTSSRSILVVRHVAVAAAKTREVNTGDTAGNGESTVRPGAPGSAQTKREVSVRQRSRIR